MQGPPGTGKTKTSLGLLSALVNLSRDYANIKDLQKEKAKGSHLRSFSHRTKRILVCAPSNGAVDEIVFRLVTKGLLDADGTFFKPHLVRVLPNVEGPSYQTYFVYTEAFKNDRRLEVFRDFLFNEAKDWHY